MRHLYVLAGVLTATSACGGRSIQEVGSGAVGEHLYVVNSGSVTVSAFGLDTNTGALSGVAGSPYPAALGAFSAAVTPAFANLYVDTQDRRVTTFSVSRGTGALTLVGTSLAFGDVDMTMTALAADPTGSFLFAANCGSESVGSLSVFALDRQTGLASPTGFPEGTPFCPNGLAVDASGRFLYVSSQYAYNGDLEGFSIDAKSGSLTPLEGSPFGSFMAVAIAIDPSSKHVYACDQEGLVRAYGVDMRTGALAELGARVATGGNPFSILTDRVGQRLFVGNWSDDTVSSYALDPMTGAPTEVQGSPFPSGPNPIVHVVDASNQFLYASNQGLPVVEAFAIGALGNLTEVRGSPFLAGNSPTAVVAVP